MAYGRNKKGIGLDWEKTNKCLNIVVELSE